MQTIRRHLNNNDLVAAVHASRRLLEHILRNVCIANQTKMKYKENHYTLIEYFNAAYGEINFHTKESSLADYYDDIFFEIEQTRYLGNEFVHGDGDEDLTSDDAKTFCDALENLQKAVTCYECGGYLKFNKWTNRAQCTNHKCYSRFDI